MRGLHKGVRLFRIKKYNIMKKTRFDSSLLAGLIFVPSLLSLRAEAPPVVVVPPSQSSLVPAPVVTPAPEAAPSAAPAVAPATAPALTPAEDSATESRKKELSRLGTERDLLQAENAIARAKLDRELSDRKAELERERLRLEELKQKDDSRLADERRQLDQELNRLKQENERLQLQQMIIKAKSDIQLTEMKLKEAEARAQITTLQTTMERQEVEITSNNYAGAKPAYLLDPLQGDSLIISDRRIPLNGPIMMPTAEYISERINYFNNKDKKHPIFIVIDYSPGGSVMAGYNILKSMESSEAPVYVVVKSFAASMAACIATLAERSFAYPNAVILHHQISSGNFGNLTDQRESIREIEEWWQRLAGPVAKKMGIGTEEFIQKMYDKVKSGDWTEFGDSSQRMKWVDVIVREIRETSLVKNPDTAKPTGAPPASPHPMRPQTAAETTGESWPELRDEKGRAYMQLPRILPKDAYYLHNPDQYYRW
jgi:ATP-dependent Clp protease, protease subunit